MFISCELERKAPSMDSLGVEIESSQITARICLEELMYEKDGVKGFKLELNGEQMFARWWFGDQLMVPLIVQIRLGFITWKTLWIFYDSRSLTDHCTPRDKEWCSPRARASASYQPRKRRLVRCHHRRTLVNLTTVNLWTQKFSSSIAHLLWIKLTRQQHTRSPGSLD